MVTMNMGALQRAAQNVADRDQLAAMRELLPRIAADREMFGQVPNADRAAAALDAAARAMVRELSRAKGGLQRIKEDAVEAKNIGDETDADVEQTTREGHAAAYETFNDLMNYYEPSWPEPTAPPGGGAGE
jgi:hypothetical protein